MYHLPKLYTAGLFLIIALTANCFCETVPEDLLTDNDEQLYKLKRDDLVDSILNEIMPPESAEDKKHEEDKSSKSTQEKQNELKDDAKSVYLSSVYPSPSTFSTANIDTIKIHTSKIASSSLSMNRSSAALNHTNIEPTQSTHELHSTLHLNQSNSSLNSEIRPSVFAIATTSRLGGNSTLLLLHSQMLVSTIVASTASLAIPSLPAPHSISTISDTAQSVIQPTSTYFAAETLPKSSVIAETPKIVNAERSFSIIKHVATETSHSPNTSSRKMPTVPDEQGYGGFMPTSLKNEKGIGFIYINVLLPIVAGITGALFITFAILLFRCCRRRRLTKVRYFGAKNKRDFVHLDQMNLLTDTSDEDDFN